jgi:hypothetical protein
MDQKNLLKEILHNRFLLILQQCCLLEDSSKAGMDTSLILFFGSQPKQTTESAGNMPSFSSKTQLHSTWIYLQHPGQFFQTSCVGAKQWLASRHGSTGKEAVEDAAISDDG